MRMLPSFLTALANQIPFFNSLRSKPLSRYTFRGDDTDFLPADLITLRKAEAGVANGAGDLVMVPYTRYSTTMLDNKKYICLSAIQFDSVSLEFPVEDNDHYFWLDSRTIGHVNAVDDSEDEHPKYPYILYALALHFELPGNSTSGILRVQDPQLVGVVSENTNVPRFFRYALGSKELIYYDDLWENGRPPEPIYLEDNEASSLKSSPSDFLENLNDDSFHSPTPTLLAIKLFKNEKEEWVLGTHPRVLVNKFHPAESFIDCESSTDFDVSASHILYQISPSGQPIPDPGCTCGNELYLGHLKQDRKPKKLTNGRRIIHSPVLNQQLTRAAWIELPAQHTNAKHAIIMVYDIEKDFSSIILERADTFPQTLVFAADGNTIFFTAGNEATMSINAIGIPPDTPQGPKPVTSPPSLVFEGPSVSRIQSMPDGKILFTQVTHSSPRDVFMASNLENRISRITRMNQDILGSKAMIEAEVFEYFGARDAHRQGWVLKPRGWLQDRRILWPVVFILYEGSPGAWNDQWSSLWNPNLFAQQGFFCILVNPSPATQFSQGSETERIDILTNIRNSWNQVLRIYPEIDAKQSLLLDSIVGSIFEATDTLDHGLTFTRIETLWSDDFYPSYDGLHSDEILHKYDVLASLRSSG